MRVYNIKDEVKKFTGPAIKIYYFFYESSGFELGFGKAGKYPGHSHSFFFDILYSSAPIFTSDINGIPLSGNLIVIPPKTYMGEVLTDDFFFIKFCPTTAKVELPDKNSNRMNEGSVATFSNVIRLEFPWYKDYLSERSFLKLKYQEDRLILNIGQSNVFLIS